MGLFQRQTVGNVEMIAVQDSWALMDPAQFFTDIPISDWDPYRDLLQPDGKILLNIGAWIVVSEGKIIIVDTGVGGRPTQMPIQEPAGLPSVLKEADVSLSDVDLVVHTHLHFDHTGWNTVDDSGAPVPLFPNARHIVQSIEWEYWMGEDERRKAAQYDNAFAPIEKNGQLDLVDGEYAVTSEMVTVPTPGHTPGHVSFAINSGGEKAYLIGDIAHQPVQVTEDTWCPNFDIDKTQSTLSRKQLLQRIADEKALVASGHFPFPGLGHVVIEDGRRVFNAVAE